MDPDAVSSAPTPTHGSSDDPSLLDFSANTNPVVPDGVRAVYEQALDEATAPSPELSHSFREAAGAYVDCRPEAVVPTRGGVASLRLAIALAVQPGDTALVPAPGFSEYATEIRLQGGEPEFVPAAEIVQADPADHALAVVCQPNNPTGAARDPDRLRAFAERCRAAGTVLLVDEAFLDFTDRDSVAGTPGVVVGRSLTKMFGLPGLRAGFAVASGELGERLRTARQPSTVSTPALAVGAYCLRQGAFVTETRTRVRRERARLRSGLSEQFDVRSSEAPFLLLDVGDRDVDSLLAAAREDGVVLRDATTFRHLDSHVRVAVRERPDNDGLLEVLADV